MRVALVHDHLVQKGGAERVLQVFQELYPKAPIFTLLCDYKKMKSLFPHSRIRTSFIQKFPLSTRLYRWYLPCMPAAIEHMDLSEYNVVLSSCSAFAKGIVTRPETKHICYCHTPTRFLWSDTHAYIKELPYTFFVKQSLPFVLSKLRQWDRQASDRVDVFVANSQSVASRIQKYYQKESQIIYPPVDTKTFHIHPHPSNSYYLIGGRIVPYKRFDIAVQAFNQLHMPLVVFGDGPDLARIKSLARPNITFLGAVSEKKKIALLQHCKAFIYPQEEDFGITAIEAMACGKPVIAYKAGGACETIIEGVTGLFFDDQGWEALADAVIKSREHPFHTKEISEHALTFDTKYFKEKIHDLVVRVYKK